MLALALAHMLPNQKLSLTCLTFFLHLFISLSTLCLLWMSHTRNFNSYANFYLSCMLFLAPCCAPCCLPFKLATLISHTLSSMSVQHLTISHHDANSYTNVCNLSFMFVMPLPCNFQYHSSRVSFLCLACLSCTLQTILTPMLLVVLVCCTCLVSQA